MNDSVSRNQLQTTAGPNTAMATIQPGFGNLQSFEFAMRAAKVLNSSSLVPEQYRATVMDRKTRQEISNPNGLANCIIALNMSARLGADPIMIMQNLYIIEGRPSWSSQFIIAGLNSCGRYSPLRFDITEPGPEEEVEYTYYEWSGGSRQQRTGKAKIKDQTCVAWAIEKDTKERLESPPVSIKMAVAEGWYTKNGSKWQTMPELMLRYRAAAFFGRLYAPELLMGLKTVEEAGEIYEGELVGPEPTADPGPAEQEKPKRQPRAAKPKAETKPEPEPEVRQEPETKPQEPETKPEENEAPDQDEGDANTFEFE